MKIFQSLRSMKSVNPITSFSSGCTWFVFFEVIIIYINWSILHAIPITFWNYLDKLQSFWGYLDNSNELKHVKTFKSFEAFRQYCTQFKSLFEWFQRIWSFTSFLSIKSFESLEWQFVGAWNNLSCLNDLSDSRHKHNLNHSPLFVWSNWFNWLKLFR